MSQPETSVAYYRVSTSRQGQSGLGLEAQREVCSRYKPVKEFTEVESGKKSRRPQMEAALDYCRENNCQLVIARLDRLSRNVLFIAQLMESKVDFVCCDFPQANRLTLHMMAAFAEHEAEMISNRTKAALQAAKNRGVKLGSHRPAHQNSTKVRWSLANCGRQTAEYDSRFLALIKDLRDSGETFQDIADKVNSQGWRTNRGNKWTKSAIYRVINR